MQTPVSNQNDIENKNAELLEKALATLAFDEGERLRNLSLFLRQKDLAHILFMDEIYRKILNVPGYIAEFGVMWGRNLNLFQSLRETHEPYNHTRHILGFDTFSGFIGTMEKDQGTGDEGLYQAGAYGVPDGYYQRLHELLESQESISHLSHIKRFNLIEGDVTTTLPDYLEENPHAFFSLCYLDLDLYEPTKAVLQALKDRMVKGSILVFDEALNAAHPGETEAIMEVFGLPNMDLRRSPVSGWKTFWTIS